MKLKHFILGGLACAIVAPASACEFLTTFYGHGDTSWVSSLITSGYCRKYPKEKFKIVVVNSGDSSGQASMGYATAFISPNFKDQGVVKAISQFSNSMTYDPSGRHTGEQLRRMATEDAVRKLMERIGN